MLLRVRTYSIPGHMYVVLGVYRGVYPWCYPPGPGHFLPSFHEAHKFLSPTINTESEHRSKPRGLQTVREAMASTHLPTHIHTHARTHAHTHTGALSRLFAFISCKLITRHLHVYLTLASTHTGSGWCSWFLH